MQFLGDYQAEITVAYLVAIAVLGLTTAATLRQSRRVLRQLQQLEGSTDARD